MRKLKFYFEQCKMQYRYEFFKISKIICIPATTVINVPDPSTLPLILRTVMLYIPPGVRSVSVYSVIIPQIRCSFANVLFDI